MPAPNFGDVHVAAALTMLSTAYMQDETSYVADKIFPCVPVEHQTDKYFVWTKDDWFRDEALPTADGVESPGSGFTLSTNSYSALVYKLHKDVGDQVRRNADPALDIDVGTTKWLMQRMLISRERKFVSTYVKTGLWGTDITGVASAPSASQTIQWNDDANSDPISDIATARQTILQNTGRRPNKLLVGYPVFEVLRKHPLIIDRIKYTMTGGALTSNITKELVAAALDIDEVVVSESVYNSASEGLTGSYSFIMGKNALLVHAAPAPGLMIPSAGYTFAWSGLTGLNNLGVRVLQIPMPWLGANTIRTEAEMAFDMQAVGTDLGYYLASIVA